ncbi:MAG: DUF748 domain-containing protein [bacterium]
MNKKKWIIATLISSLFFASIIALPYFVRSQLKTWLLDQGLSQIQIKDVDLNIFTGKMQVTDLKAHLPGGLALKFVETEVDGQWFPIFNHHLLIENLRIKNATILIQQNDEDIRAGGISLGGSSSQTDQGATPWQLGIRKLSMSNITVLLQLNELNTQFHITQLDLNSIYQWQADTPGKLSAQLELDQNTFNIDAHITPFNLHQPQLLKLHSNIASINSISSLFKEAPKIHGQIKSQLELTARQNDQNNWVVDSNGESNFTQFKLVVNQQQVNFDAAAIKHELHLTNPQSLEQLNTAIQFNINTLQIQNANGTSKLARMEVPNLHYNLIDGFSIETLIADDISHNDALGQSELKQIQLKNLKLQPDFKLILEQANLDQLSQTFLDHPIKNLLENSISIKQFEYKLEQILAINSIELGKLDVEINTGDIPDQTVPASKPESSSTKAVKETTQSDEQSAPPINIKLDQFTLKEPGHISLNIFKNGKLVNLPITLSELTMSELNSNSELQSGQISLAADIKKSTQFTLSGPFSPFETPPKMDLKGKIKGLDMTYLSRLSVNTIGYKLTQGILNAEIKAKIDQGNLTATNDLTLIRFQVEKVPDSPNLISAPLETGLGMLRNSKDEIKISIPIEGRYDDPSLDTSDVVRQAITKAISTASISYLAYALQPYGAILAAGKIANGLKGKTKLEDISFAPGTIEFDDKTMKFLDKIAKILADRPQLTLLISSFTDKTDQPLPVTDKANPKQKAEVPAVKLQTLPKQYARTRAEQAKAFLLKAGIATDRIIISQPVVDDLKGKKPYLEFSL